MAHCFVLRLSSDVSHVKRLTSVYEACVLARSEATARKSILADDVRLDLINFVRKADFRFPGFESDLVGCLHDSRYEFVLNSVLDT